MCVCIWIYEYMRMYVCKTALGCSDKSHTPKHVRCFVPLPLPRRPTAAPFVPGFFVKHGTPSFCFFFFFFSLNTLVESRVISRLPAPAIPRRFFFIFLLFSLNSTNFRDKRDFQPTTDIAFDNRMKHGRVTRGHDTTCARASHFTNQQRLPT